MSLLATIPPDIETNLYHTEIMEHVSSIKTTWIEVENDEKESNEEDRLRIIPNSLEILELEHCYIFTDFHEVYNYIFENFKIVNVLVQAETEIRKYFEDCKLELEIFEDYEEDTTYLILLIRNNYDLDEAFKKQMTFFKNWFIDILPKVKGKLNIKEVPDNAISLE